MKKQHLLLQGYVPGLLVLGILLFSMIPLLAAASDLARDPVMDQMTLQDTTKKRHIEVDVMTWDEIHQAQMESMENLQKALQIARDSLHAFNKEHAEVLREQMEQAREAYREAMEHFRSEEFRQEMKNMRQKFEEMYFPEDSIRKTIVLQMDAIRDIPWDSIYQKMDMARIKWGGEMHHQGNFPPGAMDMWEEHMDEARRYHEDALQKQEDLLEQLEHGDQQKKEDHKQKKTRKK